MSEDFQKQLAAFRPGLLLAAYRLEEPIGEGGMAVVFRARDERLGRLVALKILAPALTRDEAFRSRFKTEPRAAAMVDDPHIIPVYEAGEANGVLFIAMRFVPGGDLLKVLEREGALPPVRMAELISPVASALDAAHAAGLVHRDVKPQNILVDAHPDRPDHVYLSDFGVSKRTSGSGGMTPKGNFLGTLGYCAPEQIRGRAVDGRADQYALACVAYRLLTGSEVFDREDDVSVMYAHLEEPPPSLNRQRSDLTRAADQVLAKALAKVPEKRYWSCREFVDALRQALGVAPYHSGPVPALRQRHPEIALPPSGFPRSAAARNGKQAVPAGLAAASTVDPVRKASSTARRRARRVGHARRRVGVTGAISILVAAAIAVAFALNHNARRVNVAAPRGPVLHISPHLIRTLDGRVAGIDAAYNPNGETLVTANSYGGINIWDPAAGQKITAPHLEPYYDGNDQWTIYVAYSPNGDTWATAGANNIVSVWNAETNSINLSFHVPNCADGPGNIVYGPDGTTLATVCDASPAKIYLWDVVTGHMISAFDSPPDPNVNVVAYSPKGTTLVTADNDNSSDTSATVSEKTYLWNVGTGGIIAMLTDASSQGTNDVAYSLDGKTIATADNNGDIYLWDAVTGREIATLPTHCQGTSVVAYSPDGKTLASVCGAGGNNVNLWNVASRHIVATLTDPDTQGVGALVYSPNGTSLAVGDNNGNIYLWAHVSE